MNDQRSAAVAGDSRTDGAERRSGERYRSVWRIAKIIRDGDMGLWRVRNISSQGMMLATDVALEIGEKLQIALSETIEMTGEIVWAKDGRCGVSFDQAIDVSDVLKTLANEQQEQGYRQPRLPFEREATIFLDGASHVVQLTNVSQSGVGFVFPGPLEVGKPLGIMMPDLVRRTAVVRWRRGSQGGLWLTEPLAQADLESIRQLEDAPE